MSSSFLEKLKSKPEPLAKEKFTIKVAPTKKKVEVKDKRGERLVNREELLRKMREPRQRVRKEPEPEVPPQPEPEVPPMPEPEVPPMPEPEVPPMPEPEVPPMPEHLLRHSQKYLLSQNPHKNHLLKRRKVKNLKLLVSIKEQYQQEMTISLLSRVHVFQRSHN